MSLEQVSTPRAELASGIVGPLRMEQLVPFAAGAGALLTGIDLVESLRSGRARRAVLPGAAVLLLCVAVLAGCAACGPLVAWWMD